jgi:hypothetical protein
MTKQRIDQLMKLKSKLQDYGLRKAADALHGLLGLRQVIHSATLELAGKWLASGPSKSRGLRQLLLPASASVVLEVVLARQAPLIGGHDLVEASRVSV